MKFAIMGGDLRIVSLAEMLCADGHEVCTYALDKAPGYLGASCSLCQEGAVADCECVILPLPVTNVRGNLNAPLSAFSHDPEEILERLPRGKLICAGKPEPTLLELADSLGLRMIDYYAREELVILNALATAEGTISLLLTDSPITIWDSNILIIGNGRIGKILASRLLALGAHVTVSARRPSDLAWIRTKGCLACETGSLGKDLSGYDTIINTVPAMVLDRSRLIHIRPNCLCIDLASRPGGIDFEAARELDLNVQWALGLPAETAPVTAGRIIKETVMNIISEEFS